MHLLVLVTLVILHLASVSGRHRLVHDGAGSLHEPHGAPVYPITGAWFKDRFTSAEWNSTLTEFTSLGGDTVFLRAPPLLVRSDMDIMTDPSFKYCRSYKSSTGLSGPHCVVEAKDELSSMGLKVMGFATYQYEEDFSQHVMLCPKFDRLINSSRIYHRLVLPLNISSRSMCEFENQTEVLVVLTSFSGIDPHSLLSQSAIDHRVKVFFGLPQLGEMDSKYYMSYLNFFYRVLYDHKMRYSNGPSHHLYDVIEGYYSNDEVSLATVSRKTLSLYSDVGALVNTFSKQLCISAFISLNKFQGAHSISDHILGFEQLAKTGHVDIIAVQEGRGSGEGAYFWETEGDLSVADVDPKLADIIHYFDATIPTNATFNEQFSGSNNLLFKGLRDRRDDLVKTGYKIQYWLILEAFEYLRDDTCLPIDIAGSGMGELWDRTRKIRLDRSLTAIGAQPEKIITFAWDPCFTCHSGDWRLVDDIAADKDRPIIANCSFHSATNRSVVVIGYNLLGLTQSFTVDYPSMRRGRLSEQVYGYYYETDYGTANNRVTSLAYIQLFDVMDVFYIPDHGNITVSAEDAYHNCTFIF